MLTSLEISHWPLYTVTNEAGKNVTTVRNGLIVAVQITSLNATASPDIMSEPSADLDLAIRLLSGGAARSGSSRAANRELIRTLLAAPEEAPAPEPEPPTSWFVAVTGAS
jgi:hypothetical protein